MPIHRASQLKPYTWENIQIGEEFGPVEGILSELKLKLHAFAVDDYHPWYFQGSPFGARIGHPTLLATDILMLFTLNYDANPPTFEGGLHARNELEFLRPVFVGHKVTIRGRTTEKYQKRAQHYRVLEGEVLDQAGEVCLRMRATETVGLAASTPVGRSTSTPPDAITGEIPEDTPVVHRASRWVPPGTALPSLTKQTSFEQSVAYSGFPYGWVEGGARDLWVNIHTSIADAHRHGQPDVIVQGLCSAAYLSEMCVNFFGPAWLTSGRLNTAFIRPVIVRDTITAAALVKRLEEEEGGRKRLWLDVWCKNQRGELTTVGRASALVE